MVGGTAISRASSVSRHGPVRATEAPSSTSIESSLLDEQRVALGGRGHARGRMAAGSPDWPSRSATISPASVIAQGAQDDPTSGRARLAPLRVAPRAARGGRCTSSRTGASSADRQVLDQVEERRLRPVDVVDDHHERPARPGSRGAAGPPRTSPRARRPCADRPDRGGEALGDIAVARHRPSSFAPGACPCAAPRGRCGGATDDLAPAART